MRKINQLAFKATNGCKAFIYGENGLRCFFNVPARKVTGKAILAIVFLSMGQPGTRAQPGLIPQPVSMQVTGDQYLSINTALSIVFEDNLSGEANLLSQNIKMITGIDVKVLGKPSNNKIPGINNIYLKLNKTASSDAESYQLQVNKNGVFITAPDATGIFYGGVTLQQLLNPAAKDKNTWQCPFVEIRDKPRFKWRGLMLDCSRTFISPEYLKKTIERMSFYKMNTLHLHLTDDQGWRFQIKKYPLLTTKGAFFDARYNEPKEFQGFYSQVEMKELINYARQRHVEIVPEIEVPGHNHAALYAYPELSCYEKNIIPTYPHGTHYTIQKEDVFDVGNENTYRFFKQVIKEVAEVFSSPYIHLGGDEVVEGAWKDCNNCQIKMKELGISDQHQLQGYAMKRIGDYVTAERKRPIGWDEIYKMGLGKEHVVMIYRGQKIGTDAAKDGYDVILCPYTNLYFDFSYSTTSTQKVYSYQPVPDDASEEELKHYLGIQACFWSHVDRTESKMDFQLYPRLLALAERAWSDEDVTDYDNFVVRKSDHVYWLNFFDIKYNFREK